MDTIDPMDPMNPVRAERLEHQMQQASTVAAELDRWRSHPPAITAEEWRGPAASAHAAALGALRDRISHTGALADELVAGTRRALAVISGGLS